MLISSLGPDDLEFAPNDDVSLDILVIKVVGLLLLRNIINPAVSVWPPFLILEIASKTLRLQTNMIKM